MELSARSKLWAPLGPSFGLEGRAMLPMLAGLASNNRERQFVAQQAITGNATDPCKCRIQCLYLDVPSLQRRPGELS